MTDIPSVTTNIQPERWAKLAIDALRRGFGPTLIGTGIGFHAGIGIELLWTVPGGIAGVAIAQAMAKCLDGIVEKRYHSSSKTE